MLNFCGTFDCELDCLVGEEERRQFEEQKFVKQGKAVLGKLSKAQIRRLIGIVMLTDALGPVYGMNTDRDRDEFGGMYSSFEPECHCADRYPLGHRDGCRDVGGCSGMVLRSRENQ